MDVLNFIVVVAGIIAWPVAAVMIALLLRSIWRSA